MVMLGLMLLSGSLLWASQLNYDVLIHAQIVQMRIISLIRIPMNKYLVC